MLHRGAVLIVVTRIVFIVAISPSSAGCERRATGATEPHMQPRSGGVVETPAWRRLSVRAEKWTKGRGVGASASPGYIAAAKKKRRASYRHRVQTIGENHAAAPSRPRPARSSSQAATPETPAQRPNPRSPSPAARPRLCRRAGRQGSQFVVASEQRVSTAVPESRTSGFRRRHARRSGSRIILRYRTCELRGTRQSTPSSWRRAPLHLKYDEIERCSQ